MKLSEALSAYRLNRQNLLDRSKALIKQRDEAKKQYRLTGSSAYAEQAATLQLSIDATEKKLDKNQEVLDSLLAQHSALLNAEAARQQSDSDKSMGAELAKILTVARRISNGDKVPYTDEKKLLEYSPELYQAAKTAGMLKKMRERKEHDSLWDDEDVSTESYDPEGKAGSFEVQVEAPEAVGEVAVGEIAE